MAALSHPNILALHDIGRDGSVTFAVMELLDGRTLREVLADGALPARKAVEYGRQIADGLAAAHDRGIVHRDLKPENIFVTTDGRVKLLDFGLARIQSARALAAATETMLARTDTAPGTILGTIGYMAPEQVRGLAIDHRADIFAFGAVLYEMLGGKRAFGGATPADTMSAILNADPEEIVPAGGGQPALDRLVRRALEKEPAQRFQSARDLGFALEAVGSGTASGVSHVVTPAPRRRRVVPVVAALAIGAALGAVGGRALAPALEEADASAVTRFTLPASEFQVGLEWVALSPNGRTLAWGGNISAASSQNLGLWVRHLDRTAADPVRGVSDISRGVFLSDNRSLLCIGQNQLFTIDLETGRRTVVWTGPDESARFGIRSVTVGPDDRIAAGVNNGIALLENGVMRMVAEPEQGERGLGYPSWTADGQHLLFSARLEDGALAAFVMPAQGGPRRALSLPQDIAAPMTTPDGTVLYGQNGILWGQRFDPDTLAPDGAPVRFAGDLSMDASSGFMGITVSRSGVLAFRSPAAAQVQFEWVDRVGRLDRAVGVPDNFANFDVAPDGRLAATRREPFMNGNSLWLIDPARQLTAEIGSFQGLSFSDPAFSPDGSRLAVRKGNQVVVRTMQGGTEMVLRDWLGYPDSWSRDGRFLTVGRPMPAGFEAWAISLEDPSGDVPLVTGMALVDEARFSPDGKWVAFHAAQKVTPDVFVMPFPPTAERLQISTAGGVQPRWSPDGRELYFLDLSGQVMVTPMPGGDPRKAQTPQPLFRTTLQASSAMDQLAVSADGTQFLIRRPVQAASNEAPVQVILNWPALLPPRGR